MVIGTKLQHVVSTLALEIREQTGPSARTQVKPRDGLFWFKKPDILLWLIQFVIFQVKYAMYFVSIVGSFCIFVFIFVLIFSTVHAECL